MLRLSRGYYHHENSSLFVGHCESDPCMNGGTCNEVRDGYECICPNGYKGSDCEGNHFKISRQLIG